MRQYVTICGLAVVLFVLTPATARAATPRTGANENAPAAVIAKTSVSMAAAPAAKPGNGGDEVKPPKEDKPKKSKKNPNDDKDGDPDDGNAGGGNDNKKLPNDGPQND
jgi:hypothetical protein